MNIREMTIESKVGQLLMFGFEGYEVTEHIRRSIVEQNLGGVIYFSRNILHPNQVRKLNDELQELATTSPSQVGLFTSIDQEGGTVARLTTGVAVAPGNMLLGAVGSPEVTEKVCTASGHELLACGFNLNLAPDVDVNINPGNPVIGVRSYGEDAQAVSKLGASAIKGYQRYVAAVAKHFPGHGDTDMDSHLALPVISHDQKRLHDVELRPFKAAIAADVAGIMTAHVVFPAWESREGLPATLSPAVLTELLREELGFEGLIMTDCMEMKAIADNYGIAEAAIMTIEAGADCVLISHTPKWQQEAYEALVDAVKTGRLSEKRIDRSLERIFRTKARFGLLEARNIALPDIAEIVNSSSHQELMAETAGQGITVVRQGGALPIPSSGVMVVEAAAQAANLAESVLGEAGTLSEALQKCGVEVVSQPYKLPLSDQAIQELVRKATGKQTILVVTQDGHRDLGQQRLVEALGRTGGKTVVIGSRTPYELKCYPAEVGYIAAYGSMAIIWRGVAEVLTGRRHSTGKLPVSIPGVAGVGYGD